MSFISVSSCSFGRILRDHIPTKSSEIIKLTISNSKSNLQKKIRNTIIPRNMHARAHAHPHPHACFIVHSHARKCWQKCVQFFKLISTWNDSQLFSSTPTKLNTPKYCSHKGIFTAKSRKIFPVQKEFLPHNHVRFFPYKRTFNSSLTFSGTEKKRRLAWIHALQLWKEKSEEEKAWACTTQSVPRAFI